MINKITEYLKNKKIIILGFGIEGQSTYNFIRKHLKDKKITIQYSEKDINIIDELLKIDSNLKIVKEENYLKTIEKYDLIIKSPGISFKNIDISKFINKITSQLQLFLEFSENFTIGITGTKGKSTTSSLIYKMLEEQDKDVILLGNIGKPIFNEIDKIYKNTIVVLEISSHQLEYIRSSTNIAILLNIYEEHLDHYESFEKYIEAKFKLITYQKENDTAIVSLDNEAINNIEYKHKENDYGISLKNNDENMTHNKIYLKNELIYHNYKVIYNSNCPRKLKGKHNLNNVMFVLAVSNILKLNSNKTIKTIGNFETLEHRMEYVGNFEEVDYYNDSIATIPEATIESIKTLERVNTLLIRRK